MQFWGFSNICNFSSVTSYARILDCIALDYGRLPSQLHIGQERKGPSYFLNSQCLCEIVRCVSAFSLEYFNKNLDDLREFIGKFICFRTT